MKTRDEQIAVANTIIEQLGGRKFKVMTGARDMFATETGLSFKVPGGGGRTKKGINYIKINLDPTDTYSVEFWKLRMPNAIKISEFSMIYDDQLQDIFTAETGLDCHL